MRRGNVAPLLILLFVAAIIVTALVLQGNVFSGEEKGITNRAIAPNTKNTSLFVSPKILWHINTWSFRVKYADFDGDGKDEIVVHSGGEVVCYDNDGKAKWTFGVEGVGPKSSFDIGKIGGKTYVVLSDVKGVHLIDPVSGKEVKVLFGKTQYPSITVADNKLFVLDRDTNEILLYDGKESRKYLQLGEFYPYIASSTYRDLTYVAVLGSTKIRVVYPFFCKISTKGLFLPINKPLFLAFKLKNKSGFITYEEPSSRPPIKVKFYSGDDCNEELLFEDKLLLGYTVLDDKVFFGSPRNEETIVYILDENGTIRKDRVPIPNLGAIIKEGRGFCYVGTRGKEIVGSGSCGDWEFSSDLMKNPIVVGTPDVDGDGKKDLLVIDPDAGKLLVVKVFQ